MSIPDRFLKSITINAPRSAVWQALTSPDAMQQWMGEPEMRIEVDADFRVGGTIVISGFHHVPFRSSGTILRFEPEETLVYTHLSSVSNLPDLPASYSVIGFALAPTAAGTSLTLTIENFPDEVIFHHLDFYWRTTVEILGRFVEKSVWIVKATREDIPRITRLLSDCAASMRDAGLDQWDEVYPNEAVVTADVAAGTLYIATLGGECVGTICLNEMQSPEYAELSWTPATRVLVVHRLAVSPSCQRAGIGRVLMRFAHRFAADAGYDAIRLDAYTPNERAIRFYERLGYRFIGEVRFPRRSGAFNCYEWLVEPTIAALERVSE